MFSDAYDSTPVLNINVKSGAWELRLKLKAREYPKWFFNFFKKFINSSLQVQFFKTFRDQTISDLMFIRKASDILISEINQTTTS